MKNIILLPRLQNTIEEDNSYNTNNNSFNNCNSINNYNSNNNNNRSILLWSIKASFVLRNPFCRICFDELLLFTIVSFSFTT